MGMKLIMAAIIVLAICAMVGIAADLWPVATTLGSKMMFLVLEGAMFLVVCAGTAMLFERDP
jgi:hypothetical protein